MLDFLHTVHMKHSLRPTPELLIIELRSEKPIDAGDCDFLETQVNRLIPSKGSCALDFMGASVHPDCIRRLESAIIRLVSRAPRDLWIIGLNWPDGRTDWNHAPSASEAGRWLQSADLAWTHLSQWLEARVQETERRITVLAQEVQNRKPVPPTPAELSLRSDRRRSRLVSRQLDARRKAAGETPSLGEPGSLFNLQKLEEKILAAYASQGIRPGSAQ